MASGNAQPPAYGGAGGGISEAFNSPKVQGLVDQAQSNPLVSAIGNAGGASHIMQEKLGFDPFQRASSMLDQAPSSNNTDFARGALGLANRAINPPPQQARPAGAGLPSLRNIQALAGMGNASYRRA